MTLFGNYKVTMYVVECKQFMNGKSNSFINYANQELLYKVSTTISDRVSLVELINIKLFECGSLYSIVFITLMLPFDVKRTPAYTYLSCLLSYVLQKITTNYNDTTLCLWCRGSVSNSLMSRATRIMVKLINVSICIIALNRNFKNK